LADSKRLKKKRRGPTKGREVPLPILFLKKLPPPEGSYLSGGRVSNGQEEKKRGRHRNKFNQKLEKGRTALPSESMGTRKRGVKTFLRAQGELS